LFFWLMSLNIMCSVFFHVVTSDRMSFLKLNRIPLCLYTFSLFISRGTLKC
jgi:hypothetical protein